MMEMLIAYNRLLIQIAIPLTLSFFLTYLKIPTFFLLGLHTYIHPDNVARDNSNGVKAAIRRPSASDSNTTLQGYKNLSSNSNIDVKRRTKSKDKFEFDETNAQIFRLRLDEAHIESRLYFNEYRYSFVLSFIAASYFLSYKYFDVRSDFANGALIPVILGLIGFCKVFMSLSAVCFEKSASRRSEKRLSLLFGGLGFVFGVMIWNGIFPKIFDFEFGSVDAFGSILVGVLMGCITGFLYLPATKNARSFWLGTDQIRSDLGMISCGWFSRLLLYTNYLIMVLCTTLWIIPLIEIFVIDGKKEKLAMNLGWSRSDFVKLRLYCLLFSGVLQIMALRSNVQMYLNESLLSWYQRLHASRVPDLDFSRAKVFLHNHYLCLVALQFFAPPVLMFLFAGLSNIDRNTVTSFQCPDFIYEVALFMAWWVVFVLMVFTSITLLLYRRGVLYVS